MLPDATEPNQRSSVWTEAMRCVARLEKRNAGQCIRPASGIGLDFNRRTSVPGRFVGGRTLWGRTRVRISPCPANRPPQEFRLIVADSTKSFAPARGAGRSLGPWRDGSLSNRRLLGSALAARGRGRRWRSGLAHLRSTLVRGGLLGRTILARVPVTPVGEALLPV